MTKHEEQQFVAAIEDSNEQRKQSILQQTGRPANTTFDDLLLKHGRFFVPQPLPKGMRLGRPNNCYQNAWSRVIKYGEPYRYAEGYVYAGTLVHHGFMVDDTNAYECTLPTPAIAYFGVKFDAHKFLGGRSDWHFPCMNEEGDWNWYTDHATWLARFNRAIILE